MVEGHNIEVSFGRSGKRGIPKMRIAIRGEDDQVSSFTEFRFSREDAERLHKEIGSVLAESK